jgi:carbonic anhydrase/acetyltransferase-like protein (isoleucine patch superfamily)
MHPPSGPVHSGGRLPPASWHMTSTSGTVGHVIRTFEGFHPQLGPGSYVDDAAVVSGRVHLGARSSVWPCAVIRGDTDVIAVGDDTNVQDGAVLHADEGVPCTVGNRVTIGHRAIVHGCTIADNVLIGMGAIVMNHAVIGEHSIVAAGALVPEGTIVPTRSLVIGVPGRVGRQTTDDEHASIGASAAHYVTMIARHRGH